MFEDLGKLLVGLIVVVIVGLIIYVTCIPAGRQWFVGYDNTMNKIDEDLYENRKKVEDQCRAMIASYEQDKLTWETYKDSTEPLQQEMALNAKMRANQTANTFNNYVRENSFVWEDHVPRDIDYDLEILK